MSTEDSVVRASPINNNNVVFITRTSDDAPNSHVRGAHVPGFAPEGEAVADQPCSLKGLSGGLAAGVLGYMFGFFPSMFRHRNIRMLHVWGAEGMASAKAFAVMSGIYTTVQCLSERIRQQDDGINRLIAGGASGVAVAWRSGLVGALQSGVLLAVVSWIFDFGNGSVGPAKAATIGCKSGGCGVRVGRFLTCSPQSGQATASSSTEEQSASHGRKRLHLKLNNGGGAWGPRGLTDQVLKTPVIMWMGPIINRAYFSPPTLSLGS